MKLREVHAYLRLLLPPEFVAASQLSKKVKEECLSFPEHLKILKTVENSQRYGRMSAHGRKDRTSWVPLAHSLGSIKDRRQWGNINTN